MAEKILLVDDEAEVCFMISKFLRLRGYEVLVADNPVVALELSEDATLKAIILDVNLADLAGKDGSALMAALKRKHPLSPIILYTGLDGEDEEVKDMIKQGAHQHVSKVAPLEDLLKAVQNAGNPAGAPARSTRSK